MFTRVLIANRGTIACRVIRTLRRLGVESVAVYSDADAGSLHVSQADLAVRIGPAPARQSYLDIEAILRAARDTGAQAIHPGYGFLSENAEFAARCAAAGIVFIGPEPETMRAFGLKHTARALAAAQRVPLLPGSALLTDLAGALEAAGKIGYPVMLKATAGGGGIGMRACETPAALAESFAAVERLAANHFANPGVFVERYVHEARHVEVQIFGDGHGRVLALGERDCSLQRRNQKVIEETPAPQLPPATRAALLEAAVRLGSAVRYRSAGTVEFLYDGARDEFYFLEVNTRLQVEHGITEAVTGIDLVEWMLRVAAGDAGCLDEWSGSVRGAALEARLYAEDPSLDFRPGSGLLTEVLWPADARIETWVAAGSEVSPHYDPLLAKLIVHAADRATAVRALQEALAHTRLAGLETNLEWLRAVARSPAFTSGQVSTRALAAVDYAPRTLRVLAAGLATTVQALPGRLGYWSVGVPPSGPMDALSFRLGNRLLGNAADAAGLEMTAVGATLEFCAPARVCLTGAALEAELDGAPVASHVPLTVAAGQTLRLGRVTGPGLRAYLLVAGGLDLPTYLGSRATFTLGGFGGHCGRPLGVGDVLHLATAETAPEVPPPPRALEPARRPALGRSWILRVLLGPHAAPDFFTDGDIELLLDAAWKVHHQSSRTGVRLIGPKPAWARRDGGEAGLHPSNIHDNAYAIGAVDFTGDMPIILGPDGPSLGGFVCPFVVIHADLWKIGQLAPGDTLHFAAVDTATATAAEELTETWLADPWSAGPVATARDRAPPRRAGAVLAEFAARADRPRTVIRRQGDRYLLVEYGPMVLDLELRLRVHALMLELERLALPGILDITPGIRSLQVHFDARRLTQARLLDALGAAEDRLGSLEGFEIPSRIVHLPLSWRDPAVAETIARYMRSVRDDAPWCPDNIEFIRRVNGLDSVEAVERIVFDASYLVLGLGDVYLGAPVATPLDPRHRLVTTKYNPARTWTPPNVVGIGGAYLCIYGMEGPGGYQLFGRTVQVWNTWRQGGAFTDGKPWLLRFFDQIRFFPVSAPELSAWRRDFPAGRRSLEIETTRFRLADYRRFLAEHADGIAAFETRRRQAFDAERAEWERRQEFARGAAAGEAATDGAQDAGREPPPGTVFIESPLGGVVIRLDVRVGESLERGAPVVTLEAMKTECAVTSPHRGIVREVYATLRQDLAPGAPIAAVEPVP